MELLDALNIDHAIKMAKDYHLHLDEIQLRKDLQVFNFPLSSLQEGYDVFAIIFENLDDDYFRKILAQHTDLDEMLKLIGKFNPRIDILSLRGYLSKIKLPLSQNDILAMERMIETQFYHSDIYYEST